MHYEAVGKDLLRNYFRAVKSGNLTPSEAADRLHRAIGFGSPKEDVVKPADVAPLEEAPTGPYGVYCEPLVGSLGKLAIPRWSDAGNRTYEEAVKEADLMNRSDKHWHYYAKPIR
jgi:hypothetical protein